MPSMLFHGQPDPVAVDAGTFTCPHCQDRRPYRRVRVRRSVSLGVARVPAGSYGEYVECGTCLATYRPEVLAYDAGDAVDEVMAGYQQAVRRILALLVITDGRIHDAEVETVQRIYEAVTGEALERRHVLDEVADVARNPVTAARYLARVVGYLNDHGKAQVLRAAAMVSSADGHIHPSEAEMVRRLGAVMRMTAPAVDELLDAFR